jgi:transposase InsO family protein
MSKESKKDVWKSIRQLKISKEFYSDLLEALTKGKMPEKKHSSSLFRFKKWLDVFTYNSKSKEIELVTNELPKHLTDKNGESLGVKIKLPLVLLVVNPEEKRAFIEETWSSTQHGSYRGAQSLFKRLQLSTIGITRKDIEEFLKTTELTQIDLPKNKSLVKPILTTRPNERWQMDLIDMSKYEHWNNATTFCLTVIDHYSKFAWVVACKDKSGPTIANGLQNIILNEGEPESIQSDNGSEFVSGEMKELMERFGIEQRTSQSYRPQSNGCIERFNKTIKKSIYSHLKDRATKRYVDTLGMMVYSYNSTQHSTTGVTPFNAFRGIMTGSNLHKVITKRIRAKGMKMLEQSTKTTVDGRHLSIVKVGDEVRLDSFALKSNRKLSEIERRASKTSNWTQRIYDVSDIIPTTNARGKEMLKYEVVDQKTKEKPEEGVSYYRSQLLKIHDKKALIKAGIRKKEDLRFGTAHDSEEHLRAIQETHRKTEDDEGEPRAEGEPIRNEIVARKGKRNRKKVDHGF